MEQIGRYEIRREVGRGGMATVYLAYDPSMRRQVAIKVLPRQFMHDPKFLHLFQREAQTIAALEHPAIVPVYDFGESDDAPFLVMRYMAGGSLRSRAAHRPLGMEEILSVFERLAPALDLAHERGVIHRDLKPANVLFDELDNPYLADFGIARLAEATATVTISGTPAYMSPEQVQGDRELDGRSDLYALTVMLFELLTGHIPYEADTPTKQMMAHVLQPVPKVLDLEPDLPPAVQAVIDKGMAKDPDDRYRSAAELVADIRYLVTTQFVQTTDGSEMVRSEESEVGSAFSAAPGQVHVPPHTSARSVAPAEDIKGYSRRYRLPTWIWWAAGLALVAVVGFSLRNLLNAEHGLSQISQSENPQVPVTNAANQDTSTVPEEGLLAEGSGLLELVTPEVTLASEPVAVIEQLWRTSAHADDRAEAFIHWNGDEPAQIPVNCAGCHSTPGFLDRLGADGTQIGVVDDTAPIGTVIDCDACHDDLSIYSVRDSESVAFPSGAVLTLGDSENNLCVICHQGRTSGVGVDEQIGGLEDDRIDESLMFLNVHYLAAGATLFGGEARGGYEYAGQVYVGRYGHDPDFDTCAECHDVHALLVRAGECGQCHEGVQTSVDLVLIRDNPIDYDGDGDLEEGISGEIDTMREKLLLAMQTYAEDVVGLGIVYAPDTYPYFFTDLNGNRQPDADEAVSDNRYASWTPRLLRAAYNYQYVSKDPGAYAHNPPYVLQLLFDSLSSFDADVSGMFRPA